MMTVYHGSYVSVPQPLAKIGRNNLDFGKGFYVTNIRKQADAWATVVAGRKGRNVKPIVSVFHFDKEQALGQLKYKNVNHQLCILSQLVIDQYLHFVESITLSVEGE